MTVNLYHFPKGTLVVVIYQTIEQYIAAAGGQLGPVLIENKSCKAINTQGGH